MKQPLGVGEKRLLFAALLGVALIGGAGAWSQNINQMPEVEIPVTPLPQPNAFDFYAKAFNAHVDQPQSLYDGYDAKTQKVTTPRQSFEQSLAHYRKPEVQQWLAQNQNALQILRNGFTYEYRQPVERLGDIKVDLWTFFGKARGMTRTLVAEAYIRAAQGDWPGAANSALDAMRMNHDLLRGSPLIGALTGWSHLAMSRKPLQQMLPHLDAKTARLVARRLEELHQKRVPLDEVLTEHKYAVQANLLNVMQERNWQEAAATQLNHSSPPSARLRSKKAFMEEYTVLMDSLISLAKLPYHQSGLTEFPKDPLWEPVADSYVRPRWLDARSSIGDTLLMTALALRAYKLEHGAYPEKLADVKPNYLQEIPLDAFDGQPLRYKKQGDEYVLWSVGPDGKDDGGLFATSYSRDQEAEAKAKNFTTFYRIQHDSNGDFVFGVNH